MNRCTTNLMFALLVVVAAACTTETQNESTGSSFPERTATAGGIDVKVRPIAIDSNGAQVQVTFDSHASSFDADPVQVINLDVDDSRWPATTWEGDPPAGHHRTGTIGFAAGGPATGTATLTIDGLSQPVQFTWTIGGT